MIPMSDEALDGALREYLDQQAADRSGAPGVRELTQRVTASVQHQPRRSTRSSVLVAVSLVALLGLGGALVAGGRLAVANPTPSPTPPLTSSPAPTPTPDPLRAANGPITLPGVRDDLTPGIVPMPSCSGCEGGLDPSWSRDGSTLAFAAPNGEIRTWQDGDPSAQTVVACPDAACHALQPTWSPDGRAILFIGNGHLRVVDTTTLAQREIPLLAGAVEAASWSATNRIVFTTAVSSPSSVFGRTETVWTASSDGSGATALWTGSPPGWAAISPDGTRVALVEDPVTAGTFDGFTIRLWLYQLDGTPRRLLYDRPGCCLGLDGFGRPIWSPDGKQIALNALVTADGMGLATDIALMTFDAATGKRTVLKSMTDAYKNTPGWRPILTTP